MLSVKEKETANLCFPLSDLDFKTRQWAAKKCGCMTNWNGMVIRWVPPSTCWGQAEKKSPCSLILKAKSKKYWLTWRLVPCRSGRASCWPSCLGAETRLPAVCPGAWATEVPRGAGPGPASPARGTHRVGAAAASSPRPSCARPHPLRRRPRGGTSPPWHSSPWTVPAWCPRGNTQARGWGGNGGAPSRCKQGAAARACAAARRQVPRRHHGINNANLPPLMT